MRDKKLKAALAGLMVLAMSAVWEAPAGTQPAEIKAKPPMYSYIAVWNIQRSQW